MGEEKAQLIREAINNGISSDSIYKTLYKIFGYRDLTKYSKRQIELVISNICDMKINPLLSFNYDYSSELIRSNYAKIIDALKNGISSEEVVNKLIKAVKDNNISKEDFEYLVSLVANLKKNDFKYLKSDTDYQKRLTN